MREAELTGSDERGIVLVIDDDASIRSGIDNLLRSVGHDVLCFASVEEFQRSKRPTRPACLVLDVRMPGRSGLEFQRELVQNDDDLPIVFITAHGDIPMSVRAMKAGAIEFLTKPFNEQDLLDAINAGIETARMRKRNAASLSELRGRYAELSIREREIMAMVAAGRLNKQIAGALGLSEITVKVSRGQLMRKMQAASLADLVRMAERLGESPNG